MSHDTAMIAIASTGLIGATYAQASYQSDAANAQLTALNTEAKETQLSTQQKTLANYDSLQKLTDAQTAQATVKGFSLGSASFNAIQRASVNTAAKQQKNIDIEGSIQQENIAAEKRKVKDTLNAQLFGDVTNLASTGAALAMGA